METEEFNNPITGEKPYFIDDKKEFAWYVNEFLTKECKIGSLPVLKAICFDVYKIKNKNLVAYERVLISNKTNDILAEDSSIEGMASKIIWLRTIKKIRRTKY
jgi:hypothetical protein